MYKDGVIDTSKICFLNVTKNNSIMFERTKNNTEEQGNTTWKL